MRQEHRPRTSTEIVIGETLQMPPSKLAHSENMIKYHSAGGWGCNVEWDAGHFQNPVLPA